MINAFISALLQLLLFSLIPFLVWLFRRRNDPDNGFPAYIGLISSSRRANLLAVFWSVGLVIPLLALVIFIDGFFEIMTHPTSVVGTFRAMEFGPEAVVLIMLAAVIKTALAEEIFFRGFLAKRLMAALGYRGGNLLQAVLFGALHAALFLSVSSNIPFLFVIFFFPALGAYIKGYLNEQLAGGSIVPGWIMHATSNIISYTFIGFVL